MLDSKRRGLEECHTNDLIGGTHVLKSLISPADIGNVYEDSDGEVDRETLTETLFRCLENCFTDDEAQSLRGQLITINMPVADSLARRYFGHGERDDDLKQVAYLGLTKAVAGFEPGRGKNFLAYAVPTVTGELKKHFRDRCWTVRPPRRIQDLQRQVTIAGEELNQELHRRPSVKEIAERLDVPVEHVTEAMSAQGCFTPASLETPLREDGATTFADMLRSEDEDFELAEGHLLLEPLVRSLSERDRQIVALRFFEDWTQEQIANRLGITQMQVSRLLTRLLAQLRERMTAPADSHAA